MSFTVVFTEEARENTAEIVYWYESKQIGLSEHFLKGLDYISQQLSSNPNLYQVRRKNIRMGILKRFPYLVVYEVLGKEVVIYKVIHAHRHPKNRYKK